MFSAPNILEVLKTKEKLHLKKGNPLIQFLLSIFRLFKDKGYLKTKD